ncbi:hypothetical protein [Sinorhizobium saheli]|nr:hypothetical protein [Sinorhizobium saheli]
MSEFKLHCFAMSGNSAKVALFLALAEEDWEPVLFRWANASRAMATGGQ